MTNSEGLQLVLEECFEGRRIVDATGRHQGSPWAHPPVLIELVESSVLPELLHLCDGIFFGTFWLACHEDGVDRRSLYAKDCVVLDVFRRKIIN